MFTGIVEGIGTVRWAEPREAGRRMGIALGTISEGVSVGESIALSGACLTVTALEQDVAAFDLAAETLARTTLGALHVGDAVNLERAVRVGDRLGGHFVQGHVDGRVRVTAIERVGDGVEMHLAAPAELTRQMILKGSVALDGVSLTLAGLHDEEVQSPGLPSGCRSFHVALIPHTLANTTLGRRAVGDELNLELDMLGKYVARLLGTG